MAETVFNDGGEKFRREIFFPKETKKTRQDLNFSRLFQMSFRFKIISSFQSFSHKFFAKKHALQVIRIYKNCLFLKMKIEM